MTYFSKILNAGVVSVAVLLSANAQAQTIDYGSFEMLFGEPITTSATGKPQRASEVPATMIIITSEEIRRSGRTNVGMVLRDYAGIETLQPSSFRVDVGIRGGIQPFNPLLLVMVNGRQVYLDHFGMVNWDGLGVELGEIRQIEVVKGPQGALFGFNAVLGVINIVTYNPLFDEKTSVTAEYGENNELRLSAVGSYKLSENVGLRLSGGYGEIDDYPSAELVLRGIKPKRQSISMESVIRTSDNSSLTVSGGWNKNQNLALTPIFFLMPASFETNNVRAVYTMDTESIGQIKATVYRNGVVNKYDPFGMGVLGGFDMDSHVWVAKLEDLFSIGANNNFRLAAEYRFNEFEGTAPVMSFSGPTSFKLLAGSAMWEHTFNDKLTSTLAARIDHVKLGHSGVLDALFPFPESDFDRKLTEFAYNASLRYNVSDTAVLRAIASRGVQLPSLINLGSTFLFPTEPPVIFTGNPNLRPLVNDNFELGFDKTFPDSDMQLNLSAFYTKFKDVSVFPPGPNLFPPQVPIFTGTAANVGEFESYGVEVTLKGTAGDAVKWDINYTYNKVKEDVPGSEGDFVFLPVAFDANTPSHKVNFHMGYTKGSFELDAFARYRSETASFVSQPLGGFNRVSFGSSFAVDARAAYHLNDNFELFLSIENALKDEDLGSTVTRVERRGRIGVRATF